MKHEPQPPHREIKFGHPALFPVPKLILPLCLVLTGALLLITGCAPSAQRKLARFLFDGVPSESVLTNKPLAQVSTNKATTGAAAPRPALATGPKKFMHRPFEEGKCQQCHSGFSISESIQSSQRSTKQLCFKCHKDFLAQSKVRHQPVENGECLSCHQPHESQHTNLLVKAGASLCFNCHDSFPQKAASKHQPVENGECLACHNPHASNQKGMLVKSVGKLCFDCHDDLQGQLAKAPFKHDPAANGDCASCHSPHQANESALLLKDRRQLCADCHEDKDMAAVKAHAGTSQISCVDCHDPHLGQDKYLLKGQAKARAAK